MLQFVSRVHTPRRIDSRRLVLCALAAVTALASLVPQYALAAAPEEVQRQVGSVVVTCRKTAKSWIPGTGKGKRFTAYTYQLKQLKVQLAKAKAAKAKKQIKKLKAKIASLQAFIPQAVNVCNNVTTPGEPTPGGTPNNPTPIQDSFDVLARPVTRADVRHLMESAGYGFNDRKWFGLDNIAAQGGINALVDEVMRVRPEPAGLEARIFERLDDNLRAGTTTRLNYTLNGMREAAAEWAVNTNMPVLHRYGWETLFGKFTFSDRVLTNQNQYEVFWDLRKKVGLVGMDPNANLESFLKEITIHPMMLWYLDNASNLPGTPNENYARELQELYSMGTHRCDDAGNLTVQNYFEDFQGIRQFGDIFQATLALTGYTVIRRTIDGEQFWRAVYSPEDHRPGVKIMYRGTSYERQVESMEDVIAAVMNHPGTAEGLARDILKAYVMPNPPCRIVKDYAAVIRAKNYNFRESLSVLLRSNLFFNSQYFGTVIKSPLHRTAQFINAVGLTYADGDLTSLPAATLEKEIGVNYGNVASSLESMTMPLNSPPTVFYYDEAGFVGSLGYGEQASLNPYIMTDENTIRNLPGAISGSGENEVKEYYKWWRPQGELLAKQFAEFVGDRLGVPLSPTQLDQLEFFLNNRRSVSQTGQVTYYRDVYDNIEPTDRVWRAYTVIAASPKFFVQK